MDNDHIASMEQAIVGMQEQQVELYQKLEQFLNASTQCSDPPVPMDLDAAKKRVMELLCYRCNLPGHLGKNCPTRFDSLTSK